MKAISSQAAMKMQTRYKFNAGTELEDNFNVDYYETAAREYDAQIGRFTGIDAMSEQSIALSTYQFGGSNPVSFNDPSGLLQKRPEDIYGGHSYFGRGSGNCGWTDIDQTFAELDGNGSGFEQPHIDDVLSSPGHQGIAGASSAANILHQISMAMKTGIQDIIDENSKSVDAVGWHFTNGYVNSIYTIDGNSIAISNQTGRYVVTVGFNSNQVYNASYTTAAPELSPKSFKFTQMTKDMFEAGVSGLYFEIERIGDLYSYPFFKRWEFRNIYIGFPSSTEDERSFSTIAAANETAEAFNNTTVALGVMLAAYTTQELARFSNNDVQDYFTRNFQAYLSYQINAGATVGDTQHGKNTITTPAV
jgi:RHS repeat-associated protein